MNNTPIIINPASKHCNDVILSDAKNLVFSCCSEILHGARPELNYETLRFTQGDRRRVQDGNYNCRVIKSTIRKNISCILFVIPACPGSFFFTAANQKRLAERFPTSGNDRV
jgi:hypothetical protein